MSPPSTPHSEDRVAEFTITWDDLDGSDWEAIEAILNSGIVIIGAVADYHRREIRYEAYSRHFDPWNITQGRPRYPIYEAAYDKTTGQVTWTCIDRGYGSREGDTDP